MKREKNPTLVNLFRILSYYLRKISKLLISKKLRKKKLCKWKLLCNCPFSWLQYWSHSGGSFSRTCTQSPKLMYKPTPGPTASGSVEENFSFIKESDHATKKATGHWPQHDASIEHNLQHSNATCIRTEKKMKRIHSNKACFQEIISIMKYSHIIPTLLGIFPK